MREQTTQVFKQMFISDLSSLEIQSHCLSLQCGNDPKFLDENCEKYLTPLCRYSMNPVQGKFKLHIF